MVKKTSKKKQREPEPVEDPDVDNEDAEEEEEETLEDCPKLILPSSRITAMLRKKLTGMRFSGDNGVFVTGAIEAVVNAIVKSIKATSDAGSGAGKCKRADYKALIRAVRSDPSLSRVFAAYVFTPGKDHKLRISPKIFLNGEDSAAYDAKRAEEQTKRERSRAVPAVDEE